MSPSTSGDVAASSVLPTDILEYDTEGLVAVVCHKLRTPLTSAMGFVQLCLRDARHQPECLGQLRNLEIVDQQLRKLSRMIDELSDKVGVARPE